MSNVTDTCAGGCSVDEVIGPFSTSLFIQLICCLILPLCAIRVVLGDLSKPVKRKHGAKPEFGFGAGFGLVMMAKLGVLFGLPGVVLFFIWKPYNLGIACLIQHTGLGFPLWPVFFTYFALAMLFGNFIRLYTRFKVVASMNLQGNEHILVTSAYKGVFTSPIALALQKSQVNGNVGRVGSVVAVDNWKMARVKDWCEENCFREGVQDLCSFRQQEKSGHLWHLPAQSDEFDLIVVPFGASMPFTNGNGEDDKEKAVKQMLVARELFRCLKPGGRVISFNMSWSCSKYEQSLRDAGGFADIVTHSPIHWLTAFPARVTEARKPLSGGVASAIREVVASVQAMDDSSSNVSSGNGNSRMLQTSVAASFSAINASHSSSSASVVHSSATPPHTRVPSQSDTTRSANKARNSHNLVRASLVLFYCGVYAVLTWATQHFWCQLLIPSTVPWSNQVSTLLTSNLTFFPIVAYFSFQRVTVFCKRPDVTLAQSIQLVLRVAIEIILGLTFYNVFFWFPSFLLDVLLYDRFSDTVITLLNTLLNFLLFYVLAKQGPKLWVYIQKRMKKEKQEAGQNAADDDDEEAEEIIVTNGIASPRSLHESNVYAVAEGDNLSIEEHEALAAGHGDYKQPLLA